MPGRGDPGPEALANWAPPAAPGRGRLAPLEEAEIAATPTPARSRLARIHAENAALRATKPPGGVEVTGSLNSADPALDVDRLVSRHATNGRTDAGGYVGLSVLSGALVGYLARSEDEEERMASAAERAAAWKQQRLLLTFFHVRCITGYAARDLQHAIDRHLLRAEQPGGTNRRRRFAIPDIEAYITASDASEAAKAEMRDRLAALVEEEIVRLEGRAAPTAHGAAGVPGGRGVRAVS
jgi:hypothetical protein